MKLSGGDLLMRALRDEGVKFIFGTKTNTELLFLIKVSATLK